MRCSVSLLNFRKVSIESLGGNGTPAVIVAKTHKFDSQRLQVTVIRCINSTKFFIFFSG